MDPRKGSIVGVGGLVGMDVEVAVGGMGVEVVVGVIVNVLVAAAAAVAVNSSGEGPQAENNMPCSIKINPRIDLFFIGNMPLLLLNKLDL